MTEELVRPDIKDLLAQLPSGWHEVTLRQFKDIMTVVITEEEGFLKLFNGSMNTLAVVSKLTGVPVDVLEDYSIQDVLAIGKKVAFINDLPSDDDTSFGEWKKPDEVTLKDFKVLEEITFNDYTNVMLEDVFFKDLDKYIRVFYKVKMSEDELLNQPMDRIWQSFFLLNRMLKKYTKHLIWQETKHLMKLTLKERISRLKMKIKSLWQVKGKKKLRKYSK